MLSTDQTRSVERRRRHPAVHDRLGEGLRAVEADKIALSDEISLRRGAGDRRHRQWTAGATASGGGREVGYAGTRRPSWSVELIDALAPASTRTSDAHDQHQ